METITAYKERIKSYAEGQDPITLQKAMPARLGALVHQAVTSGKQDIKPHADKWSIKEIVAHLADDELVGAYRIRLILSSPGTEIQAFDQAAWAVDGRYALMDIERSLALFVQLREANLALFGMLRDEEWERYGNHAERGNESIADIAAYYAGHDINHLKQIEAILGS